MRELVLFLPAVGGDPSFWAPQVKALADRYDVLALDLHEPDAAKVSMPQFADRAIAAIRAAGHARAHLVGLSMGGVVAQHVFRRAPELVASLTLANSWAWAENAKDRLTWLDAELTARSVGDFSKKTMSELFAPTTDRAVVARAIAVESAKPKAPYQAAWHAMFADDLRPWLGAIDVPVLLIGGALDQVTPTRPMLTDVRARVPSARLVELAGASHFSNLDAPDEFTRVLRAFLRDARVPVEHDAPAAVTLPAATTAEHLLRLLALRGVDAFYSNSGTDFTPIIDALAHLEDDASFRLRVVAAPHENTTIAMAHGHALMTGRPQVVMGHVSVGTMNLGLGIVNARRARVPMLVMAGRTPLHEAGLPGVRTNFVQWGQESRDQAAAVREYVKWDYELRGPHALDTVVDRALAIATSEPQGPVYLTLPKEPLCADAPAREVPATPRITAPRPSVPDAAAMAAAFARLRGAARPVIVVADLGRFPGGPEALVRFAERWGAAVIEHGKRNFFNFPTEHPHHLGFEPLPFVADADLADLIVAVECPVPWIPALAKTPVTAPVIQIGVDPLFEDLPLRGFPSDLTLRGDPVAILRALGQGGGATRSDLHAKHETIFAAARTAARADAAKDKITKSFLSVTIGDAVDDDAVIWNEYDLDPLLVPRRTPASWFENSCASGLGWSLGAALGAKIAAPERTMIVTLGDGSYLFNTPLSAHHVAMAERLPILIVVFDDAAWSTIKKSTRGSHPHGHAARTGRFALCDFPRSIDFAQVAAAAGGVGIRVEKPAELPTILAEAISLVRSGDRHVLLDVICERDA